MDASLPVIAIAGLAAGAVHVWSGMDHLAALTPLSFGKGPRAAITGASWGLGHSIGVVSVALLAVALKTYFDIHVISQLAERLVGVMLIGIGLWGIRQALRMHLHVHTHAHDGESHVHLHTHVASAHHPACANDTGHRHTHAAVAVGTLHGFAGAGHLFALLPAVGMSSWGQSCVYLCAFTLGTVVAMGLFAGMIGWASFLAEVHGSLRLAQRLMFSAAGVTTAVGIAWLAVPLLGWPLG